MTKTATERAREIVAQWKYAGKGCDITMPFSDHDMNSLADRIASALTQDAPNEEDIDKASRDWAHECVVAGNGNYHIAWGAFVNGAKWAVRFIKGVL